MKIDWSAVKKQTLWSYEDLIAKLQDVLSYGFVQEHYEHTIPQALDYAARIRRGYLQDQGPMTAHIDAAASALRDLEPRWSGTYSDLVSSVATRAECVPFLQKTGFDFAPLIQVLHYLLRWVLPFKAPLREFIDVESPGGIELHAALKNQGIKSNLDLLEAGRTEAGRRELARGTGIPEDILLALAHRADLSRLAYVRGKTVGHLCGGCYDTLEKLAKAESTQFEEDMDTYFRTTGKAAADFKAVIPLLYMIGGAKTIPRVMAA